MNADELKEAIDFIELQIKLNRDIIKDIKLLGYDTSKLEDWDRIYGNIQKYLKED